MTAGSFKVIQKLSEISMFNVDVHEIAKCFTGRLGKLTDREGCSGSKIWSLQNIALDLT